MSPLLGAGDFLSWSRTLPRECLPQPGELPPDRDPDPVVFGDWHPPGKSGWAVRPEAETREVTD